MSEEDATADKIDYSRYLQVLENTDRYLIVNKRPGVSFHADDGEQGLLGMIRRMEDEGLIESGPRLFPVHRLDKVSSGILIFARGRKNADEISNEFRHKRARKFYAALSDRTPKKKQGRISGDMVRGRRGVWFLDRTHRNPAVTQFFSKSISGRRPGLRLYLLRPKTGRTHQLRVAMKSLGAPILGDPRYGRFDLAREEDRCYLHAFALRFRLGKDEITAMCDPGPGIEFESGEFKRAFAEFADPFAMKWPD